MILQDHPGPITCSPILYVCKPQPPHISNFELLLEKVCKPPPPNSLWSPYVLSKIQRWKSYLQLGKGKYHDYFKNGEMGGRLPRSIG